MKKARICFIAILTLCMFLLAGCGEKDKFDKDHAEVIKLMEQAKAVDTKDIKIRTNDDLTMNQDDIKAVEEDIADTEKRHQAIIDQVNEKLKEMQGYADKEASLAPQLENIKKEVKEQDKQWHEGINEVKAITDMQKHSKGAAPTYDPYKGHLKLNL
jgi:rubrerythrin